MSQNKIDINKWLDSHTFHHTQFRDVGALVDKKREQNIRISVCIPTLNEEQTIAKVIVLLKAELIERYPLIDELAVIDSGSDDRTLDIARSFGAQTYLAQDILPDLHAHRGKGENLWKAIFQLHGDIIVYIDADIKNIHPRFVYGLVGPLLLSHSIKYVKAFYDRPLAITPDIVRKSGGGRVTEILIRPLFSLLFPELTAIIQPLSGEYAVRRDVLEQLAFPIGYGVETAHLIDVYYQWGMTAFAQTDLDRRVHRNQPTADLGRMAFGILQTFFSRAKRLDVLTAKRELSKLIYQFEIHEKDYNLRTTSIVEVERPPMISVPAYRQRRGTDGDTHGGQ